MYTCICVYMYMYIYIYSNQRYFDLAPRRPLCFGRFRLLSSSSRRPKTNTLICKCSKNIRPHHEAVCFSNLNARTGIQQPKQLGSIGPGNDMTCPYKVLYYTILYYTKLKYNTKLWACLSSRSPYLLRLGGRLLSAARFGCTHACMHACMHACIHACMHTCIHKHKHEHKHTDARTCAHPYAHTHTHTNTNTHTRNHTFWTRRRARACTHARRRALVINVAIQQMGAHIWRVSTSPHRGRCWRRRPPSST